MKKYMEETMKKQVLTIIICLVAITSLFAQTSRELDYNIVSSGTGYGVQGSQFVIEIQIKAYTDVAELGTGNMRILYNSNAMTLNQGSSFVNPDIVNYGGGYSYSNDHVYSPATGKIQTGEAYIGGANPANAYDIPTSWLDFAHVVFDITDPCQTSQIAWIETAPETQFAAEDNMTVHTNHSFAGNVDILLGDDPCSLILSSFTAMYSSENLTLYWSTHSETNNKGWNIYRGEYEDAFQNDETFMINSEIIPGAGTNTEPSDYTFTDIYPVTGNKTYWYWLESYDFSGQTQNYGPISLTIPDNEGENPDDPDNEVFGLFQNYPNPVSNYTSINFNLKEAADCTLNIYNSKGQFIRTFKKDNTEKGKFTWDGRDKTGKRVSSGIYFYTLKANDKTYTKKMILQK